MADILDSQPGNRNPITGEELSGLSAPKLKWYYRPAGMIMLFLGIGPLMLPLIFMHPTLPKGKKNFYGILIIGLSIFMFIVLTVSIKNIIGYYSQLSEMMKMM